MAKEIPLTRGMVTIVDDEDFDYLSQWKWCVNNFGYVVRNATVEEREQGFPNLVKMHRAVLNIVGEGSNIHVDHINGDKLDNRKENLRLCSPAENRRNNNKYKNNTSGFIGVSYIKRERRYMAHIKHNHRKHNLGFFVNPKEAAFARDVAAKLLHGEFCRVNGVQLEQSRMKEIEQNIVSRLFKKGLI